MGNEWHYTQNGQPAAAPITTAQLKQLAAAGLLKPEDLVWQEGLPNWVPASSVKGLFGPTKPATGELPVVSEKSASSAGRKGARTKSTPPAPTPPPPTGIELNPVLVFVLTLVTLGLFGLWYAFKVNSQYSARASRATDSAGRPLGRVRHPIVVLLLSWITLGFYLSYWIYRTLRECCAYTDRQDLHPRTELCLMLLFPFYGMYLAAYRLPELIRQVQELAGVPESRSPIQSALFLNPCLFCALPLLCMTQQDALNQVWLSAP